MPTEFYKMTGSGNDFVMLDGRVHRVTDWPAERIVAVCDRRNSVGADGFVVLTPVAPRRVRMSFFNSDGSEAAMCGNAALCSTVLATHLSMSNSAIMELETGAGTFPTRRSDTPSQASLNLPDFQLPRETGISRAPGELGIWLATVGVPHLTVLVDDVEKVDLAARGRELRFHPGAGPAGANVNFVAPAPDAPGSRWLMRTYERGVEGETLACGTGAVATAVALGVSGRGSLPAIIVSRSGRPLEIRASLGPSQASQVWLSGEGRLVFSGMLPD